MYSPSRIRELLEGLAEPSADLESIEERVDLLLAVQQLPAVEDRLAAHCVILGETFGEAAATLGCSPHESQKRIRSVLRRLSRALNGAPDSR